MAIFKVAKSLAGLAWSSASQSVASKAGRRAGTPHPPFWKTKNQLKPLPKMRRIFHSGGRCRVGVRGKQFMEWAGGRLRPPLFVASRHGGYP